MMSKTNKILAKNLLRVTLFCCLAIHSLLGQSLKEEVATLQKEYEALQLKYWQEKETYLNGRKEIKEDLENWNQRLADEQQRKNEFIEERYLLKETISGEEEDLDILTNKAIYLKEQIRDNFERERQNLQSSYPYLLQIKMVELNKLNKEREGLSVKELIGKSIGYKLSLIKEGETIQIYNDNVYNAKTKSSDPAKMLRLGFVQHIYHTGKDAATLLRINTSAGTSYEWHSEVPSSLASAFEKSINEAFNKVSANKKGILSVPVDVNQSGKKTKEILGSGSRGLLKAVVKFFRDGGFIMYPMLGIFVLAIFLSIKKYLFLSKINPKRIGQIDIALNHLQKKEISQVKTIVTEQKDIFYFFIAPFLEIQNKASNAKEKWTSEKIEQKLEEVFTQQTPLYEKGLSTLAILGAVAPLLGLLGTVTGMIELFDVITLYGTSNPRILAGGISIALVTTQAGLGLAVPIMLIHHFLVRKKNSILEECEKVSLVLLNFFSEGKNTKQVKKERK